MRTQIKWINIDKQEPERDQFVFFISEENNNIHKYDEEDSKTWCYDFGIDTGIYFKDGFVEDHYDLPMTKIRYWSPAPRFEWDIY